MVDIVQTKRKEYFCLVDKDIYPNLFYEKAFRKIVFFIAQPYLLQMFRPQCSPGDVGVVEDIVRVVPERRHPVHPEVRLLRRVPQPRPQARVGGTRHVFELQPLGDVEEQRRDEARQDEDHEVEHAGVAATWKH